MGRGRKMNRLACVSHQPLWTVTPDWVNNGNSTAPCAGVCVKTEYGKKTNSCCVCASGQGLATTPPESHTENVRQCFNPSHLLIHWRKGKSSRTLFLTVHPSSMISSIFSSEAAGPTLCAVAPTLCNLHQSPRWRRTLNLAAQQQSGMRWKLTFVQVLLPVWQITGEKF